MVMSAGNKGLYTIVIIFSCLVIKSWVYICHIFLMRMVRLNMTSLPIP